MTSHQAKKLKSIDVHTKVSFFNTQQQPNKKQSHNGRLLFSNKFKEHANNVEKKFFSSSLMEVNFGHLRTFLFVSFPTSSFMQLTMA